MEVRIWGARGSLPASVSEKVIREKVLRALEIAQEKGLTRDEDPEAFMDREIPFGIRGTYGTNTPCVEVRDGEAFIICDSGSGIRDLGNTLLKSPGGPPKEYHILLSHPHWDHIQGFPFFTPIYIPGNRVTIYGCHEGIEKIYRTQHSAPFFPVDFSEIGADVQFVRIQPDRTFKINGFSVTPKKQNHPGDSYGYRICAGGRCMVYSTDSEHRYEKEEDLKPFADFFRDADLLIFDAQYTFVEANTEKINWGHANNLLGVELGQRAGVKRLCLYHQDPVNSDEHIDAYLEETRALAAINKDAPPMEISIAYEGLTFRF